MNVYVLYLNVDVYCCRMCVCMKFCTILVCRVLTQRFSLTAIKYEIFSLRLRIIYISALNRPEKRQSDYTHTKIWLSLKLSVIVIFQHFRIYCAFTHHTQKMNSQKYLRTFDDLIFAYTEIELESHLSFIV